MGKNYSENHQAYPEGLSSVENITGISYARLRLA
jgi:hypothetical protein